jgi:putative endonuclease
MLVDSKKNKGQLGEERVVSWLKKNGYQVLDRNFLCRLGEIDIIAQKNDVVSFIEVKTRHRVYFNLSEVINKSKQKKIISAAKKYISRYGSAKYIYQFDVALVEKSMNGFEIDYLPNAFYGAEFY